MKNHMKFVTLPLTSKRGGQESVPKRSGLNWGQRPGRNPDQAYIHIPVQFQDNGFFPDRGELFLVKCDDDETFSCVRSQDNGKALETPEDNSILGRYFRKRLGVRSGHLVTVDHLMAYGRTSVDIHYVNDFSYFLDFSILRTIGGIQAPQS